MKSASFIVIMLFSISALAQQDGSKKSLSKADILFREKVFDFGEIRQGEKVSKKFTFRNAGSEPLMILNVQTTCGCTATDWPKQPLAPGDSSQLTVTFNSERKSGRINKIVTVYTNGQRPEERLKITGNVLSPDMTPTQPAPTESEIKKE